MRFSDEEYLRAWKEDKIFPKIHQRIFDLFSMTFEAESVIDLCCCTGLIGQHIKEMHGINVVGVEGDPNWIERGKKWGIELPIYELWITPDTLATFLDIIKKEKVTGIVARRCISELFGNDEKGRRLKSPNWPWAEQFSEKILNAGITELWFEGRADQGRSVHPIPGTDEEIQCFSSKYKLAERYQTCAYMIPK